MTGTLAVGLIGCGNIAAAYLSLAPQFHGLRIVACADLDPAAAQARADEFNVEVRSVDALLASDDIDIVVNLTIPAAHVEVSRQVLQAGKHVYSEKPFVLSVEEGEGLAALAEQQGLRIGSAPDTFLGGAHQQARALIDRGAVGRITSGTAHVMGHGMEHWHPNPDFFYQPGAGPVLDIGPYYITNLVQLLGPVKRVAALSATPRSERVISSEPRAGEMLQVRTPTTFHALLEFQEGAVITLCASWDVWQHGHHNMELYGENGTLYIPDPNFFGGELRMTDAEASIDNLPAYDHPFSIPNQEHPQGMMANYRAAGLADMAMAIQKDRPHRCSLELALHVVDVMTSILHAAEAGSWQTLGTTCERPEPLGIEAARTLLV